MVNILKYKHKLCKKYKEDIWGFVVGKGKFTHLGEFLSEIKGKSYRTERVNRSKLYKNMLQDRKKVCLFYGGLKVQEFNRYCAEAKRINKTNFNDTAISLFERRLDVFIYRLNFVSSVAESAALIKAGCFLVNREQVLLPYRLIHQGDIVEICPEYRDRLKGQILARVTLNKKGRDSSGKNIDRAFIPMLYPKYVEVNYQIMAGILLKYPVSAEVYYPFYLKENFYNLAYFSRFA